jgi:hypothetical protein
MIKSAATVREMSRNVAQHGEELMRPSHNNNNPSREHPDLDRRYGEVGISAVVAALRYGREAEKPARAPAAAQATEEREGVAA